MPPSARPTAPVRVTEVGHWLLGVGGGWELFGRGFTVVVRVQPALGRVTTTVLPALDSGGPVTFLAGRGGAVVRPLDSVAGYAVPDGHPAVPLRGALAQGGQMVPGPDPDHVWMPENGNAGGRWRLVGLDGRATGTSVAVPATAAQTGQVSSDGAGYVTFTDTGGVYESRPDGVHRITGGALLAAGPSGWVTSECDDQDRCTTVVVDRVTGGRRDLHVLAERAFQPGLVSPDGMVAALYTLAPAPGVRLLDLASGVSHRLAVTMPESGFAGGVLAWSPDSRWLFLAGTNDGKLYAVNPHTGALTVVDPALPPLSQVAVRIAR